ncbi:hypothetical protein ADL21_00815 [Streptomyces albus subsp. albus]|nr:hypothetical protein ADL21_00815 [Streptomyces albus subsp. albus]
MRPHEVRRFAYAQGAGKMLVTRPIEVDESVATTAGRLPDGVAPARGRTLPTGTWDLLEEAPYPHGRPALPTGRHGDALGHALATAFSPLRREPSNPYNDHRGYPSVRSKFPVHVYLVTSTATSYLDVYARALLDVPHARGPRPGPDSVTIVLAGRYTHLPGYYERLRAALIDLELGVSLRTLLSALELFALPAAQVQAPVHEPEAVLAGLGITRPEEWAAPISVTVTGAGIETLAPYRPKTAPRLGPAPAVSGPGVTGGTTLPEVLRVNRAAAAGAATGQESVQPGNTLPTNGPQEPIDWSRVYWNRNSGRMPLGLTGMSGRRQAQPASFLAECAQWLAAPLPGTALQDIARRMQVLVCTQDIAGMPDGVHRWTGSGYEQHRQMPSVMAELERVYGYPLAPANGCAVRHASAVWLLTGDMDRLVEERGATGWSRAQFWCGWTAQALSMAAASHSLYARPVRAFDEIPLQRLLGLDPAQLPLFAVISGAGRFEEPMLDLRI